MSPWPSHAQYYQSGGSDSLDFLALHHGTDIFDLEPDVFTLLNDTMSVGSEMHDDFIQQ